MDEYIKERENVSLFVLLLDSRHPLSEDDINGEENDSETIGNILKSKIRRKAVESVKKSHRGRPTVPSFLH